MVYLGIALMGFVTYVDAATELKTTSTEEVNVYAKYYGTPLCVAISKGEVDVVRKFIEYGADINEKTNGMTPLMYAARYNEVEIIKLLLDKGANLKLKDDRGNTALNHAENSNATEAIELLKNYSKK